MGISLSPDRQPYAFAFHFTEGADSMFNFYVSCSSIALYTLKAFELLCFDFYFFFRLPLSHSRIAYFTSEQDNFRLQRYTIFCISIESLISRCCCCCCCFCRCYAGVKCKYSFEPTASGVSSFPSAIGSEKRFQQYLCSITFTASMNISRAF